MISAVDAINNLKNLSNKMAGLSVQECRIFDHSLGVIETFIQEQAKTAPKNVTPIKPNPQA